MSGTSHGDAADLRRRGAPARAPSRPGRWRSSRRRSSRPGPPSTSTVQPAPPTRGGGGLADPLKADLPLVVASPASVSFGLVKRRRHRAGPRHPRGRRRWRRGMGRRRRAVAASAGASLTVPADRHRAGPARPRRRHAAAAADGDAHRLRAADARHRRPPAPVLAARVTRPALGGATSAPIGAPGLHTGNTRGKPSLVSRYRYPDVPPGGAVSSTLRGPGAGVPRDADEAGRQLRRRRSSSRASGVQVEPRVVAAGDENRLTGYPALPVNLNPYLAQFGGPVLAAGAVRPLAGAYDVVFDSATAAGAGSFTFRYWVNDTRPPT